MKKTLLACSCITIVLLSKNNSVLAQDHQLVEKWHTDSVLKTPESVLYDGENKVLYTSNIGGAPAGKNGKGSIGKVGLDGKIMQVEWVTGLNGPKGLGRFGNTLYAADVDEVVAIDIKAAKIINHYPVKDAQFLNDITVDDKGVVYVSDSKLGKIHKIENGTVSTIAENVNGVNGLLAVKKDLYVLASGALWKFNGDKKTKLADGMDQSTDGVEMVKPGEFVVSCWTGAIYFVKEDGTKQQMLDTRTQKINSADIGYDSKSRIVYVPTFFKNSIVAYELK
ncbi:MAG: ATP/GTP-binding protein [Bacteroidetes bacterium]|nr:ATP/GTP-binding protein [Bacteroidota bacterium]